MNVESGDILYAVLVIGVMVLGYRIVRSAGMGVLAKTLWIGGGYYLLFDFYNTYGWELDTAQTDFWQAVSPEWTLTAGVVVGLIFMLRDRYAPMLSEAGAMVHHMQRKAKVDLDRQRRDMEADLRRQKRESDAEVERNKQQAQEELKRKADEDWERLQEKIRDTKAKLQEEEERLQREREAAAREQEKARQEQKKPDHGDPYEVLGLSPDATPAEIKKRYRELMAQYHPDKAAQTTPEIQKLAEERVKEINWAHDTIFDA